MDKKGTDWEHGMELCKHTKCYSKQEEKEQRGLSVQNGSSFQDCSEILTGSLQGARDEQTALGGQLHIPTPPTCNFQVGLGAWTFINHRIMESQNALGWKEP